MRASERGLVILPDFHIDVERNSISVIGGGGSWETAIRRALPYWDRIDLAINRGMGTKLALEVKPLIDEQIIAIAADLPEVWSGELARDWVGTQIAAWKRHEREQPGQWVIGQNGETLTLPKGESVQKNVARVSLCNLLPVPHNDVPLEEILKFKEKRHPELLALRRQLDEMYATIAKSDDPPREFVSAANRIEEQIVIVNRVAEESWVKRLLSTIKVEINLEKIVKTATVAGAATAHIANLHHVSAILGTAIGTVAGAAAASIKLENLKAAIIRDLPDSSRDFAYLFHLRREL